MLIKEKITLMIPIRINDLNDFQESFLISKTISFIEGSFLASSFNSPLNKAYPANINAIKAAIDCAEALNIHLNSSAPIKKEETPNKRPEKMDKTKISFS